MKEVKEITSMDVMVSEAKTVETKVPCEVYFPRGGVLASGA